MIKRLALLALVLVVMSAFAASAEITWTVDATASGGDINNMTPGDTVTIDVTLRSDGVTIFGVGGAAYGYDLGAIAIAPGGLTSSSALNQVCVPSAGCFGGLESSQEIAQDGPTEIQFFNAVSTTGSTFTGEIDEGVVTGVSGDPQFHLVFTVNETTSINIGDGGEGDGALGTGGLPLMSNNAVVNVTIPEPGAVVSSLAALGTAFAVVGFRRRS